MPSARVLYGAMAATAARSDVEIAQEMYEAFNEGDIETVLARMTSDIVWTEPAGSNIGGAHIGPEAVATEVFGYLGETFESFSVGSDRYMDCGDCTVVVGRMTGTTKAGATLDIPYVHLLDFEEGKLSRFQNYTDTALWIEAVGAGR